MAEVTLLLVILFGAYTYLGYPLLLKLLSVGRKSRPHRPEEMDDGDGPIDAAFLATEKITGIHLRCTDYQVRSATLGHDALGEVTIEVEHRGEILRSRGTSTDTVEATVRAILDAVNRIAASAAYENGNA